MKYDVFISCSSTDDIFVAKLFTCLQSKRIKTFSSDGLRPTEESLTAIEESKISVIVFSEEFGDSKRCLDEVVAILKCKERFGQIVIPVIEHVKFLDVEYLTGRFGYSFTKLQVTSEKFKRWMHVQREALTFITKKATLPSDGERLVNKLTEDIEKILLSLRLRVSKTKVIIEWTLAITNLMLEIPSCVLDQMSSTLKPSYALAAMLLSLLACLVCLIDLIYKGITERVVWRWTWPIPWFYYPTRRSNRFGSFAEMVGLLCALCQSILTTINYSFITRKVDAPIKVSVWPIIFALGVLFTMYVKQKQN